MRDRVREKCLSRGAKKSNQAGKTRKDKKKTFGLIIKIHKILWMLFRCWGKEKKIKNDVFSSTTAAPGMLIFS